jgi:hypothetical protein
MKQSDQRWSLRRESSSVSSSVSSSDRTSWLLLIAAATAAASLVAVIVYGKQKSRDSSSCNSPDDSQPPPSDETVERNAERRRITERNMIPEEEDGAAPRAEVLELSFSSPISTLAIFLDEEGSKTIATIAPLPAAEENKGVRQLLITKAKRLLFEAPPRRQQQDEKNKNKNPLPQVVPSPTPIHLLPESDREEPDRPVEQLEAIETKISWFDDACRQHDFDISATTTKDDPVQHDHVQQPPAAIQLLLETTYQETDDDDDSLLSAATVNWVHLPIRFNNAVAMKKRVKNLGKKLHKISKRRRLPHLPKDNNQGNNHHHQQQAATGDIGVPPSSPPKPNYKYLPEFRC